MNDSLIKEFAQNNETPFYVFDTEELNNRINCIKKILPENAVLCYAIKANPFLLNELKDKDLLFEVCSDGELEICRKYNVEPSKIVFSGVCKTLQSVKTAYDFKVKTITLESLMHCNYLIQTVKEASEIHEQEVILRLSSGNQFGMSAEDIEKCIELLNEIPSVKIRGIHYFSGTQKQLKKITEEIEYIGQYCSEIGKKHNLNLEIEYGPGLSFNYFSKEPENTNFTELENFSSLIKNSPSNYVIELGRYIASSCGSYITKIMDLKENHGNRYCIIDGGINHINYYGQMMGMKIPQVIQFGNNKNKDVQKYTICGSLCTTADVVLRELELNSPQVNDILCFKNIGAYSITEGIYLFLSHSLPQVYLYKNGDFIKIRDKLETYNINS